MLVFFGETEPYSGIVSKLLGKELAHVIMELANPQSLGQVSKLKIKVRVDFLGLTSSGQASRLKTTQAGFLICNWKAKFIFWVVSMS